MNLSFSTVINITVGSCILTAIFGLLIRHNRMIAHFGTTLLLGITFLLMLRFLFPVEFTFTKSIYIYNVYPALYHFFADNHLLFGKLQLSICDILLGIWIVGSCILFLRSALQYVKLKHFFSHCKPFDNDHLLQVLDRVNAELGSKKQFQVIEVPDIYSPMIFGIFRPYILVPRLELSTGDWHYIFRHELTHYYHGHLILKMLFEFLCDIYWWNPAVYFLRRFMKLLTEMNADRGATSGLSEEDTCRYIHCLANVAAYQAYQKSTYEWTVTFVSPPKTYLKKRGQYLLENMGIPRQRFYLPTTLIGVLFGLFFVGSVFLIFEPSSYEDFSIPNTWDFSDEGCFLLRNEDGTYSLYIDWKYNADWQTAPTDDPYIQIYNNLKEAQRLETQK